MAAKPTSFFAKQPKHIRDIVLKQYPHRCAREMAEHLHTLGVQASKDDVLRFRRNNGVKSGWHYVVQPAGTHDERVGQYIEALRNTTLKVFTNRQLSLKGYVWSPCAKRLQEAGLIARYNDLTPAKYVRCVEDDVIAAWYSENVLGGN